MDFGILGKLGSFGKRGATRGAGLPTAAGLPIAIDFGTSSLKILQISEGNPRNLVAAACLETPADIVDDPRKRLEFQLQALPKLIRQGGFRGKRVSCAVPSWQMVCKHLQFPRQEGVSTGALVEAAISQQFACDPQAVVQRHIELSATDKSKTEVIVFATPRELVDKLMRGIQAAGLEPVGIHSDFVATLRAFDDIHQRDGNHEQNTLYLDIGAGSTKVMISHGTALAFARTIDMGGHQMDTLVAKQLACDAAQARKCRLATGETITAIHDTSVAPVAVGAAPVGVGAGPGTLNGAAPDRRGAVPPRGFTTDVLSQPATSVAPDRCDLTEPLEILTDDVLMCLRYHQSQFPGKRVDRAVFVGGEARHRGLCQQIARRLRLPAQMADPLARLSRTGKEPSRGVDMKVAQPGWSVAVGLTLCPTDL